jgi:DNA-binding NarL/FixJ family response regulator
MRVLIGMEHELTTYGLIQLIKDLRPVEYIVTAKNGEEVLKNLRRYSFDLLIVQESLPGAIGMKSLLNSAEETTITTLICDDPSCENSAGADAVIFERLPLDDWMKNLDRIIRGEKMHQSPSLVNEETETLTRREEEVYRLKIQGYSVRESAGFLNISEKTIENHRRNIAKKLQLHSKRDWIEKGKILGFL